MIKKYFLTLLHLHKLQFSENPAIFRTRRGPTDQDFRAYAKMLMKKAEARRREDGSDIVLEDILQNYPDSVKTDLMRMAARRSTQGTCLQFLCLFNDLKSIFARRILARVTVQTLLQLAASLQGGIRGDDIREVKIRWIQFTTLTDPTTGSPLPGIVIVHYDHKRSLYQSKPDTTFYCVTKDGWRCTLGWLCLSLHNFYSSPSGRKLDIFDNAAMEQVHLLYGNDVTEALSNQGTLDRLKPVFESVGLATPTFNHFGRKQISRDLSAKG